MPVRLRSRQRCNSPASCCRASVPSSVLAAFAGHVAEAPRIVLCRGAHEHSCTTTDSPSSGAGGTGAQVAEEEAEGQGAGGQQPGLLLWCQLLRPGEGQRLSAASAQYGCLPLGTGAAAAAYFADRPFLESL